VIQAILETETETKAKAKPVVHVGRDHSAFAKHPFSRLMGAMIVEIL
jgi:hypothetical protein